MLCSWGLCICQTSSAIAVCYRPLDICRRIKAPPLPHRTIPGLCFLGRVFQNRPRWYPKYCIDQLTNQRVEVRKPKHGTRAGLKDKYGYQRCARGVNREGEELLRRGKNIRHEGRPTGTYRTFPRYGYEPLDNTAQSAEHIPFRFREPYWRRLRKIQQGYRAIRKRRRPTEKRYSSRRTMATKVNITRNSRPTTLRCWPCLWNQSKT